MEELKRCPFCGGEAEFHRNLSVIGDIVTVRCKACKAKTAGILFDAREHQNDEEYDEAAALWNTRKPVEDVLERIIERMEMCSINEPLTENGVKVGTVKVLPLATAVQIVKEEGLN